MNDVLARVAADGQRAVSLFLPSIANPPQPPPPPPNPMALENPMLDVIRALKLAGKVEEMSYRTARGLPPIKPKTPEEEFGNVLDVAHTRALSRAIANHPEEEQGRLIAEAHDQATKWIAANNGKVVVHGEVKTADSPKAAESLAAQIVNDTVREHDEREAGGDEGDAKGDGSSPQKNATPSSPAQRPLGRPGVRTNPARVRPQQAPAPNPRVAAPPTLPPPQPPDNGSPAGPGAILGAPPVTETPSPQVPPDSPPPISPEETPQVEATALDSGSNGDTVPLSVEPDESQGTDMPGPDPGEDEQLPRGISGRTQGGDEPKRFTKGDVITLKNGSRAEVQWHHPAAGILRAKIDGKNTMLSPGDLAT